MTPDDMPPVRRDWERLEPDADATERARRAVLDATPAAAPPRRPRVRWSRRGALAVALLAVAAVGAATAGVIRPWDRPREPGAANETARARIMADPLLMSFPWVMPDITGPTRVEHLTRRVSLAFPSGVTRRQAVESLHRSVMEEGRLPAEATVGDPLPAGKAARIPAGAGEGLVIDPALAFGYDVPGGRVQTPSWTLPRNLALDEARARMGAARDAGRDMPEGARLYVPPLDACQVIRPDVETTRCELSEIPPHPWDGPADAAQVSVPDMDGLNAGEAAAAAQAAGLRVRFLHVVTPAFARERDVEDIAVSLDVVRDEEAWRKNVGWALVPDGEPAAPGSVLGVHPPAGTPVRQGSRLVVAAVVEDCIDLEAPYVLQADCVPGTNAARDASTTLRRAPWLHDSRRTTGSGDRVSQRITPYLLKHASTRPSVRFPAGVTRAQALQRLYTEAIIHARLPQEATLGDPLPHGIVYRPATRPGEGVTIDLRAVFGYDPDSGRIHNMGITFRADLTPKAIADGIAAGRYVELPTPLEEQILPILPLPDCQVATPDHPTSTCEAARRG